MIIPEARRDGRTKNVFAAGVTAGGMLVLGLLLLAIGVPEPELERSRYREIDLERYIRLIEQPEVSDEQQPAEQESEDDQAEPERAVRDARPQRSTERIDLSDVLPQGLRVDLSPDAEPSRTRTEQRADASGGNTALRIEAEDLGEVGGIEALSGFEAPSVPRGRRAGAAGVGDAGIAVADGSGSGAGTDAGEGFGTGSDVLGGPSGRAGNAAGAAIEVGLQDISDFGDDYETLDIRALIEWMKQNPGELPVGIRQHVQYEPDYLASVVTFRAGQRLFELYLMCKEALYEVHIVLVENESSTYLIDRSFQRQSRYLRRGRVARDQAEIVAVDSRQEATGSTAERFYAVFLSWWEVARQEIES